MNACKPSGEWQTLDIMSRALRFDASGKKTANTRFVPNNGGRDFFGNPVSAHEPPLPGVYEPIRSCAGSEGSVQSPSRSPPLPPPGQTYLSPVVIGSGLMNNRRSVVKANSRRVAGVGYHGFGLTSRCRPDPEHGLKTACGTLKPNPFVRVV
jgi:hypothetical protein